MDLTGLWSHQKKVLTLTELRRAFALFWEMGTGKTKAAIYVLRQKCNQEKKFLNTLIVSPLITLQNWKNEFKAHSKFTDEQVIILEGSEKERMELFLANYGKAIFLVNYEAFGRMSKLAELFLKYPPDALFCDESHKLKNTAAKQTKAVIKIADKAKYKFLLTGTPVLNNPMDIFGQFRVMLGGFPSGEYIDKNFFNFRSRFFFDKNAGMPSHVHFPDWKPRPNAYKELNSIISMHSMRVLKEEVLDLPDFVEENLYVGMLPEQEKHYNEMRQDFLTYVGDKACVADLAITKALRLQQIVSGYIPIDIEKTKNFKHTPRQVALRELLEELTPNNKVVIWAVFHENYNQISTICRELNIGYVEVHGLVDSKQKYSNVDSFSNDDSVRVFIGNPLSAGLGINLVSACYNISFSRNFSLEAYLQAKSRSHRGGQVRKVTWINLVTPDTIDELILKALDSKELMGEKLLSVIKHGMGQNGKSNNGSSATVAMSGLI